MGESLNHAAADCRSEATMINKIIEFSAEHKFLVFLFIAVAAVLGWHSMKDTKLDAIPDLSDTQVIVYAKWDRSPDIMEDQVAYPITSALLGMPKVKDIRAFRTSDTPISTSFSTRARISTGRVRAPSST